jgi:16S rRNA (adenine1518-N6/adenine1519-N6)-dimethyltransferase
VASAYPYFSPVRIQNDLARLEAAPRKRWGQCFLIEPGLIDTMAGRVLAGRRALLDAVPPDSAKADAPILEIGPGLGALTWPLLQQGANVAAVEIDPAMGRLLTELATSPRGAGDTVPGALWLLAGDAREALAKLKTGSVDFGQPGDAHPYRLQPDAVRVVCGNLPYYITTDLLVACMNLPALRAGYFLTQLEFAERIVAADARSSLNVYLRNFGEWRQTMRLKASAFFPRPRVDSAFIEFRAHDDGPRSDGGILQKVLRMSFGARRKKLSNSWKQDRRELLEYDRLLAAAASVGVDVNLRAEAVPVEAYYRLATALAAL